MLRNLLVKSGRRFYCTGRPSILQSQDPMVKRQVKLASNHVLSIKKNDLTEEHAEAIVNAANGYLKHGGGIAGAIVSKGGHIIQQQSNEIIKKLGGGLGDGQVVSATAGNLPADYVFHAVGPIYNNNPRAESSLHLAVTNCLKKANVLKCKSIALPAISTGIFGYPKDAASNVIMKAILEWCEKHSNQEPLDIRIVNFDDETVNVFVKRFDTLFGAYK
eukprot:TRINITY_DN4342_c0_g1_i1.p1 TRINITY_DN4342_c0_g1~~TRINITY_DN4342_c0_g1_i1.p1  ORF type:complete len:218 (-),score=24.55 TRINITY_DN4342_c0_g1_i1:45-698(-)